MLSLASAALILAPGSPGAAFSGPFLALGGLGVYWFLLFPSGLVGLVFSLDLCGGLLKSISVF